MFVQWWTAEGAVQQWSHPLKPGLHCSVGDTAGCSGHSSWSTQSDISWFLLSLGEGVWADMAVISLWTDPWCTLGRCWWSTAGQKRNLRHSAATTASPWVAGSGSEPHWNPAVWTTRNRKNSTGQSCCYRVFNDLPQVKRADSSAVSQWMRSMLMTGCVCVRACLCSSVKGPELINMYVGQSEENIREGFTSTLFLCLSSPVLHLAFAKI